jgi:hypothetical protein
VYVASYVALFIDAKGLIDLFKRELSIGGETADPTTPVQTGTTLILGALLLVAVFSTARWRRASKPAAATEAPVGTAPDNGEPFGLGPGDAGMFRAPGATAPDTESLTGRSSTEEPSTQSVPAQSSGTDPTARWSTSSAGTPAGSPWSTPLRDDGDKNN